MLLYQQDVELIDSMAATKEAFLQGWKRKFPYKEPPDYPHVESAVDQKVKAERCRNRIFELEQELTQQQYLLSFLEPDSNVDKTVPNPFDRGLNMTYSLHDIEETLNRPSASRDLGADDNLGAEYLLDLLEAQEDGKTVKEVVAELRRSIRTSVVTNRSDGCDKASHIESIDTHVAPLYPSSDKEVILIPLESDQTVPHGVKEVEDRSKETKRFQKNKPHLVPRPSTKGPTLKPVRTNSLPSSAADAKPHLRKTGSERFRDARRINDAATPSRPADHVSDADNDDVTDVNRNPISQHLISQRREMNASSKKPPYENVDIVAEPPPVQKLPVVNIVNQVDDEVDEKEVRRQQMVRRHVYEVRHRSRYNDFIITPTAVVRAVLSL